MAWMMRQKACTVGWEGSQESSGPPLTYWVLASSSLKSRGGRGRGGEGRGGEEAKMRVRVGMGMGVGV